MTPADIQPITVDVADPASIGCALQLLHEQLLVTQLAVGTLASILGATIATKEGADSPKLTLTAALFAACDVAEATGKFSAPIIQNLRMSLQSGCDAIPPPDGGTFLRIIEGGTKAA